MMSSGLRCGHCLPYFAPATQQAIDLFEADLGLVCTGRFTAQQINQARRWLAEDPDLSGTAIGQRLGTKDSYGRKLRRAALAHHGSPPP